MWRKPHPSRGAKPISSLFEAGKWAQWVASVVVAAGVSDVTLHAWLLSVISQENCRGRWGMERGDAHLFSHPSCFRSIHSLCLSLVAEGRYSYTGFRALLRFFVTSNCASFLPEIHSCEHLSNSKSRYQILMHWNQARSVTRGSQWFNKGELLSRHLKADLVRRTTVVASRGKH